MDRKMEDRARMQSSFRESRSRILDLASEVCLPLGVEVVDVEIRRGAGRWTVRLDIDRPGARGVTLDDCQAVSRALESAMEDNDPIDHSYTLEVSSPGLDRPIRTAEDVRRNTGRAVVVETLEPVDGRRRFKGTLMGLAGDELLIRDDEEREVRVPLAEVASARQDLPF
jgi:ribosome maturation factor RimP